MTMFQLSANPTLFRDNPSLPSNYRAFREVTDFFSDSPYAHFFQYKLFAEHMQGSTLIDLGSSSRAHTVTNFAKTNQIARLVLVDRCFNDYSTHLGPDNWTHQMIDEGRVRMIGADMLDFVSHLQSNRRGINFLINGIDDCVIDSRDYFMALAKELTRVVAPGALVGGANSLVLGFLPRSEWERVDDHSWSVRMHGIFRKL